MQEIPDILLKWSEINWETGKRVIKDNAPNDVKMQAVEYERKYYSSTARRTFENIEL